jgi:hypothetical protein
MPDEFLARDTPDPADPDVQFGLAPEQSSTGLIELREEFLRSAGPTVHTELREILTENGYRPCRGD